MRLQLIGPSIVLTLVERGYAAFENRKGAKLRAYTAASGEQLAELELKNEPVFDGMIAADGKLFISLADGSIACFAEKDAR